MIWEKVRGHAEWIEMFRRSIRRGRLAQAYLFMGPEGVGKKLFARSLSQCLLCRRFEDVDLEACGECSCCRQMTADTHPDFHSVGVPDGKSELPIELLAGPKEHRGREGLCYELSLRPMSAQRRIAVIDDAQLMNAESANALLKTLEELPPDSLLILIATNAAAVLPTIRSRCQQVRFAALPQADVADLLIGLKLTDDRSEAETLAALSGGSLTVAGQLLNPELRRLRESLYNHLAGDHFNAVAVTEKMLAGLDDIGGDALAQRKNASWLIRFAIEFYRRALRALAGGNEGATIAQVQAFVDRIQPASADELELLMELLERAALAESRLNRKTPVPICLEGLFEDLGQLSHA